MSSVVQSSGVRRRSIGSVTCWSVCPCLRQVCESFHRRHTHATCGHSALIEYWYLLAMMTLSTLHAYSAASLQGRHIYQLSLARRAE